MKRMLTTIILVACLIAGISNLYAQNVGINTPTPDASAALDVVATDRGVLIPRLALTATGSNIPVAAPATSLLVYNTATVADVTPGFYYWDGAQWVRLSTNSGTDDQNLTGATLAGTTLTIDIESGTSVAVDLAALQDGVNDADSDPTNEYNTNATLAGTVLTITDAGGNQNVDLASIRRDAENGLYIGATGAVRLGTNPLIEHTTITQGVYNMVYNLNSTGDFKVQDAGLDHFEVRSTGNSYFGGDVTWSDVSIGGTTIAALTDDVDDGRFRIYENGIASVDLDANTQFVFNEQGLDRNFRVEGNTDVNLLFLDASTDYIGIGLNTPTNKLHVEDNASGANQSVIYARNTNSGAGISYGVRGEVNSTAIGSAGVLGLSTNGGDNEIGTAGDYTLWGAGVFGLGWSADYSDMATSRDFGVYGVCDYFTGTGVYGEDINNSASSYAVYAEGKFAATGTKSASVPTSKGNQLVYCMESPEIWFEDLGVAQLVNGEVHITLDEMYNETVFIDEDHPMHVFLQEQGDCNGLYFIPDADGKGFIVKEKAGGSSSVKFSYRIMGKRRFYQDHRFGVDSHRPFGNNLKDAQYIKPYPTDPAVMEAMVEEARVKKEAEFKAQQAEK